MAFVREAPWRQPQAIPIFLGPATASQVGDSLRRLLRMKSRPAL